MPNVNAPFGLRPYSMKSGAPYNGAVRTYYVPASNPTALYIGDPLVTVTNSSDTTVITLQQTQTPYLASGQAAYVVVSDDPDLLYAVQEDGSGGASMVSGASGRNANLLSGTGNTFSGQSGWTMQTASLATTAAHQLHIIQLLQSPLSDNAVGQYARWLVKINQGIHPFNVALGV